MSAATLHRTPRRRPGVYYVRLNGEPAGTITRLGRGRWKATSVHLDRFTPPFPTRRAAALAIAEAAR